MSDPLSLPKLPLNISEIVYSKERIQRAVELNKHPKGSIKRDPKLRDACLQMESLFIHYLLKEMRATIHKSGFIGGGRAEEIYTSMLDAETAKKISARGGIGLAEMMLRQLDDGTGEDGVEETDD
jgi:Rod binding domain-containing protein